MPKKKNLNKISVCLNLDWNFLKLLRSYSISASTEIYTAFPITCIGRSQNDMLHKNSSLRYQCCVYHHIIQETISLALCIRDSVCPATNGSLADCGKLANLAFFLCAWMNSRAFLSSVEGVQLQPTGLHPGTDLSQARQKAGEGVICLWYKDDVWQHVSGGPVVTQTPPHI